MAGSGMIAGCFHEPGQNGPGSTVELEPGDLLVPCTDGITEAMDVVGAEFSRTRLAGLVSNLRASEPEEILSTVLAEVDKHSRCGTHEDDRILLVMKSV
jgi:serine phosphatase RsbU (regulator of sigma subunit)